MISKMSVIGLAALLFSGACVAGGYLSEAARGAALADFTLEKCTGSKTPDDVLSRQMRFFIKQGLSSDEVAQSFQVAMFQVESSYRGGAKPPRSECVQSQKMYNELMGGIR